MSVLNQLNTRLNEEWSSLSKQFWKFGADAAGETAGTAAEALKTLAKEITKLGERLERWVASTRKTEAGEPAKGGETTPTSTSSTNAEVSSPPAPTVAGPTIAHGGPALAVAAKQAAESAAAKPAPTTEKPAAEKPAANAKKK